MVLFFFFFLAQSKSFLGIKKLSNVRGKTHDLEDKQAHPEGVSRVNDFLSLLHVFTYLLQLLGTELKIEPCYFLCYKAKLGIMLFYFNKHITNLYKFINV